MAISELSVNRSIDLNNFPIIKGSIPFSIFKSSQDSGACQSKPEAYVIDIEKDWKSIVDKINSGNFIFDNTFPEPHFDNSSLLVYLFGQLFLSGHSYAIDKIEGIPSIKSIYVNIKFVVGHAEALSCPYIILAIPKTGYKTVIFKVEHGSSNLPNLKDF